MEQDNDIDFSSERALTPKSEGVFNFRGHEIRTATMSNGQGFVSLRSLCDGFGINYRAQQRRVMRTEVFKTNSAYIRLTSSGGIQSTFCMYAFAVPSFLVGVETDRLASDKSRRLSMPSNRKPWPY